METEIIFKRVSMVLTALLLLVVLSVSGNFTAYADGESFSNHSLSFDGGVKASYNATTKVLTISGAGEVVYDKWVAMAQKINPYYFNNEITPPMTSWGGQNYSDTIDESNMKIVFSGAPKAIKLCGTEEPYNGLFKYYSGQVSFNGAVDLSPHATNISCMFAYTTQFNEPVDFDTSHVTKMYDMFEYAEAFNQPVTFDTSKVTNMGYMFSEATSFNQPVNFDTSNVTSMRGMFRDATSFNQPISFDISSLNLAEYMFEESKVETVILKNSDDNLNVSAIGVFKDCTALKHLEFSGLKDVAIDGFSGDYQFLENGGLVIMKDETNGYSFNDNQNYFVHLQDDAVDAISSCSNCSAGATSV